MLAASPPIAESRVQDDRVRWGTLMALTLLQQHRGALDACAAAFDRSADIGECIEAIEAAASEQRRAAERGAVVASRS